MLGGYTLPQVRLSYHSKTSFSFSLPNNDPTEFKMNQTLKKNYLTRPLLEEWIPGTVMFKAATLFLSLFLTLQP